MSSPSPKPGPPLAPQPQADEETLRAIRVLLPAIAGGVGNALTLAVRTFTPENVAPAEVSLPRR